ncbi:class I SAM-dependent RNA methyltransferase [Rhodovibrionaceae bacterium A322]
MRKRARKGGGRQAEVEISSIGGQGDGVALLDGRPVFVPLTVVGDRLRVRILGETTGSFRAESIELIEPGPDRADPPCSHYGPCGGCSLQHLSNEGYLSWKSGLLKEALKRQGFDPALVAPMVMIPPGRRRRTTLAARLANGQVRLGFHRKASPQLVDLQECHILTPTLFAAFPALRRGLAPLLEDRETADLTLTESETGIDLAITSRRAPDLAATEALSAMAEDLDLARISWAQRGESLAPLLERRAPLFTFGKVAVVPPAGGFLQPTAEGQKALVEAVLAAVPDGTKAVVDLFSGSGTFTFPLVDKASVHAVEGDAAALQALAAAASKQGLVGPVTQETRDLARQPLRAEELNRFDLVVFDPPRNGAKEQSAHIAASAVPTVVAVSCNPTTFARDARILREGGYDLVTATPVDQFPWTAHLELVAVFKKQSAKQPQHSGFSLKEG